MEILGKYDFMHALFFSVVLLGGVDVLFISRWGTYLNEVNVVDTCLTAGQKNPYENKQH